MESDDAKDAEDAASQRPREERPRALTPAWFASQCAAVARALRATPGWVATQYAAFRRAMRKPPMRALALLCVIGTLSNSDQSLQSPLLTPIADSFNFTADERDTYIGGYVPLGFFVVGGATTLVTGYLSDKVANRVPMLCFVVLVGEVACIATLAVTDFWGYFASRIVTGVSIGGQLPIMYALVGDLFTDKWRGKALSAVVVTSSLGIAIGQGLASFLGPPFGWRVPYAVVGVVTILFLPVILLFVRDPGRGVAEPGAGAEWDAGGEGGVAPDAAREREQEQEQEQEQPRALPMKDTISLADVKKLAHIPTAVLIGVQGLPGSLPWGMMQTYYQSYLIDNLGIPTAESSVVLLAFGAGSGLGLIAGGIAYDKLWLTRYEYVPIFTSVTTAVGALPIYGVTNAGALPVWAFALACLPAGFLATMTGSCVRPMLANVTPPELRGSAYGAFTLLNDLGTGLGPFWVSLMINAFGARLPAFNCALLGWFACALLNLAIILFVRRDARRVVEAAERRDADARAEAVARFGSKGSALVEGAPAKALGGDDAPVFAACAPRERELDT